MRQTISNSQLLYIVIFSILLLICLNDFMYRTISNFYLSILTIVLFLGWLVQPNWQVWPYTLAILIIGLLLFRFGILAAGDAKLLAILSLGIDPIYMPLTLLGIVFFGGVMAIGYLFYGLFTDLAKVRQRGIPYGVPICLVGGLAIVVSAL
ncbi:MULTISPECIES: prepilin peptidase [Vibrio]|uniref:prepilin peptidase n=1 Tax=Vibrio TaxID=662 RepID=UPI0021CFA6C2|nr:MULTISPECIES: prepilin peptidase [unclassified Vibrio]MDW2307261.1 prepilin peptidase [Vibrio sp. 1457]MDW2317789.1 prepilin peptidase [Vibrio sp. 1456-1]